jgi:tetratricopeptide (TPR) repeat protein
VSEHAARLAHHAFRGEVWGKALRYLKQTETAASRASLDAALIGSEAGALWWNADYARAIEVAQRDLAVAAGFRNFDLSIVTNLRLGEVYHALADYRRAADLFRRTRAALQGDLERERCGMAGLPAVYARAWLAWCLAELGDFVEGIAQGEEGAAIAEAADHAYSQVLAAWALGTLHVVRGDPGRAVPVLERALVVIRMADTALLFPFVATPLGAAYALSGRVDEALSLLEEGLRQAGALNLRAHHPLRLVWLGEALLRAGELARATDLAMQASALAEEQGERGSLAYAWRLTGEVTQKRGPPDDHAAAAYARALDLANELGMRPLAARCRMGLAAVRQRTGERAAARAELDAAHENLRELGMRHWFDQVAALRKS